MNGTDGRKSKSAAGLQRRLYVYAAIAVRWRQQNAALHTNRAGRNEIDKEKAWNWRQSALISNQCWTYGHHHLFNRWKIDKGIAQAVADWPSAVESALVECEAELAQAHILRSLHGDMLIQQLVQNEQSDNRTNFR